jgi:ssDNA-binding replication factor A large subunit
MIKGLDAFARQLNEAARAAELLDGTITTVKFDPADPASVGAAIDEMEHAVDAKVARYRSNPLVADLVKQTKAHFRDAIRQKADEAAIGATDQKDGAI